MKRFFILSVILAIAAQACTQGGGSLGKRQYVKHLVFPRGCSLNEKVEMAASLVPTPMQLEWHNMECTAFLHFGINTFTDREWGDGSENPSVFNPTDFDADQWVRTLRDTGFKMVILTAKHHDGFCLWPTTTTEHSVASSPWRDGQGDVVREVSEACARNDLKFGVYLSPWDRNAPCYGDSPAYNNFFIEQLTELLTNYGAIYEVWFDGACGEGPNGKIQEYDWDAFCETIHRLQPYAVTAIMGDDIRWVGNEGGVGREMEWSATVKTPGMYDRVDENDEKLGITGSKFPDLGSRNMLEKATELFWYPSEVDVSIRPGWFYHKYQDTMVKSLKDLVDIYFCSVGRNSVLLLNIPPDPRGRIHPTDSIRLCELANYIRRTFKTDYVTKGEKLWKGIGGDSKVYKFATPNLVNVVMLQENIANGQHVDSFTVEALVEGTWLPICNGTTIGHKRLLRFPAVEASALRLNLVQTRTKAEISRVGAFYAVELRDKAEYEPFNDLPREKWVDLTEFSDNVYSPLTIDISECVPLSGFTYIPPEDNGDLAYRYTLEVSKNGRNWKTLIKNGEFANIINNPIPQRVAFKSETTIRYIRFSATTISGEPTNVALSDIGLLLPQ